MTADSKYITDVFDGVDGLTPCDVRTLNLSQQTLLREEAATHGDDDLVAVLTEVIGDGHAYLTADQTPEGSAGT